MELPVEILLEVISQGLTSDRQALNALSLSCKDFRGVCLPRIFTTVDLSATENSVADSANSRHLATRYTKIYELLIRNPSLSDHIQHLILDLKAVFPLGQSEDMRSLMAILAKASLEQGSSRRGLGADSNVEGMACFLLQQLKHVRHLTLSWSGTGSVSNVSEEIVEAFKEALTSKDLRSLTIANFRAFPASFLQHGRFLRDLHVNAVDFSNPDEALASPINDQLEIRRLSLQGYHKTTFQGRLAPFFSTIPLQHLENFKLDCSALNDTACTRLLQDIGTLPQLRHLAWVTTPFNLNDFLRSGSLWPQLKHVEIDFAKWQWETPDVAAVINILEDVKAILDQSIPLPAVEEVTVKLWLPQHSPLLQSFRHPTLPTEIQKQLMNSEKFPQFRLWNLIIYYDTGMLTEEEIQLHRGTLETDFMPQISILRERNAINIKFNPWTESIW